MNGEENQVVDEDRQQLEVTVSALQGGVADLTPATAIGLIDQWRERLGRSDDARLRDITDDLATLAEALRGDAPDPGTIGDLLQGLARKTKAVAADGGAYAAQLQLLGNALEK